MQGTLQPGVLPKLLGQLYVGAKSGLLHVARDEQSLDVELRDGQIVGVRGLRGREALFDSLSWDEGVYSFQEGAVTPGGEQAPDLSMPQVIREGVHRLEDPDVVCYALGDLDRVLAVAGVGGPWMASAPADDLVLSRVDGTRSAREVIEQVALPAEETQRIILGLLCMGILEFARRPDGNEGLREIATDLEVTSTASREPREGRGPLLALDHLEALGIPRGVLPEDPLDNALMADDVIRKAVHLMAESDNWSAIQILEAIMPAIHSKKVKHDAQVVLARACSRNPKWVKRGEDMLLGVVREDPACLDAYLQLGMLYKQQGLKARALAMFRKVSELKPGHALAAAEIRSLSAPPPHRKLF